MAAKRWLPLVAGVLHMQCMRLHSSHNSRSLGCLQYYKNFKGFKTQVDGFRGRLQTLLTSLPVRRLPPPSVAAC
jgi:hypothetical protein